MHKIINVLKHIVHYYREIRIKRMAAKADVHYHDLVDRIKKSGRKKLNYAAYVIFDSTYGMDAVFKKMMEDPDHWNPKIVVIPDVLRGRDNAVKTYKKTKAFFVERYGKDFVLDGWNPENDEYYDYLDRFDIVYYANPYDDMAHKYHKIQYAAKKDVLPIYVSYGYDVGRYTTLARLKTAELNLVWKLFADTTYTYHDYVNDQIIKGKNVVLAGYSKMDGLANYQSQKKERKRILITPHHTVNREDIPLSNFLEYSDLILDLPNIFPNVEFVFRPHPLLFTTLLNEGLWTSAKIKKYINDLQSKNILYSTEGDYLGIFAQCDAIVNDCGSFTVEWLYTGKPGCFVYNKKLNEDYLTTLMNKAIANYTIARSKEDIIAFIKSIADSDIDREYYMQEWVKDNIALNYPDVSSFILKQIDILNQCE